MILKQHIQPFVKAGCNFNWCFFGPFHLQEGEQEQEPTSAGGASVLAKVSVSYFMPFVTSELFGMNSVSGMAVEMVGYFLKDMKVTIMHVGSKLIDIKCIKYTIT